MPLGPRLPALLLPAIAFYILLQLDAVFFVLDALLFPGLFLPGLLTGLFLVQLGLGLGSIPHIHFRPAGFTCLTSQFRSRLCRNGGKAVSRCTEAVCLGGKAVERHHHRGGGIAVQTGGNRTYLMGDGILTGLFGTGIDCSGGGAVLLRFRTRGLPVFTVGNLLVDLPHVSGEVDIRLLEFGAGP